MRAFAKPLALYTLLTFGILSPTAPTWAQMQSSAASADNEVQVLNTGVAALELRLQMIEKAQSFIDVEYFIYNTDEAGKIFTLALLKKKKENPHIHIRVMVDGSPTVLQLSPAYITQLTQAGIEVRYYNPTPPIRMIKTQYRDHRKLLVVDGPQGLEAITGGRNIADEYFDMNPTFNFRDRDMWVQGPVTEQMRQSFEDYWRNENTVIAPQMKPPEDRSRFVSHNDTITDEQRYEYDIAKYNKDLKAAHDFVHENVHDRQVLDEIRTIGVTELSNPLSRGSCARLNYVTDAPGFDVGRNIISSKRHVLKSLLARIRQIPEQGRLVLETPYFIAQDATPIAMMNDLNRKKIKTVLLTNGLASTDAVYVAANFIPATSFYHALSNGSMFLYSGNEPTDYKWIQDSEATAPKKTIWSIHAKTYVFGHDGFAIGTFNLDPRSANLNNEILIYCEGNQSLTSYVVDNIDERISQSGLINRGGLIATGEEILKGATLLQRLEFVLALGPARVFESLM